MPRNTVSGLGAGGEGRVDGQKDGAGGFVSADGWALNALEEMMACCSGMQARRPRIRRRGAGSVHW